MDPKNQEIVVRFLITLIACYQDYQISKEAKFTPKALDLWSSNDSSNVLSLLQLFTSHPSTSQSLLLLTKPKQHRIGCRQQRKRKFRITDHLNIETWINEVVCHGEIIRNGRKVSQSPLPLETSANGEVNKVYYLPKTPKRLIDPDVNQETCKQLSHSLPRFMKWQTSRYSWVEYTQL